MEICSKGDKMYKWSKEGFIASNPRVIMTKFVGVIDRITKDGKGREEVFVLQSLTDSYEETHTLDDRMFPFKRIVKVKIEEVEE